MLALKYCGGTSGAAVPLTSVTAADFAGMHVVAERRCPFC